MLMAIFLVYSTSDITSGKKVCRELKMAAILKIWNIKHSFNLTSHMKTSSQIMPKKYFHDDDVIDDVTGSPQIGPLYSFINEITTFFMITKRTSKDIIIKLPVHRYHEIMTTIIQIYIHDVIDDVTRSQNRSNFEIDISPSIFELDRRSKAQNVGNAHGHLSRILNFRYSFGKKVCR